MSAGEFKLPDPPEGSLNQESGAPFRKRQEMAATFGLIVRQLIEHDPDTDKADRREDALLDAISNRGITGVGIMAWEDLQNRPIVYVPASVVEVRDYLDSIRTNPPIKIKDLGSVDDELIKELGFSEDNYIEELRALLSHLDSEKTELSVLELLDLQRSMFDLERLAFKDVIVRYVLDMHGIQPIVIDREDQATRNELAKLAEGLCGEVFRDYSKDLRARKDRGKITPMHDIYSDMEDILRIRDRAIALATGSAEAGPHERQRMLETLSPLMRKQVEEFFDSLDTLKAEFQPTE